jgi:hypothetical protein
VSTPFSYEHVFDAPSKATLFAAYFDPEHLAQQDAIAQLADREVKESHEDELVKRMTWLVRSARPLPLFVRPFVDGGRLSFLDTMSWRKADDEIDFTAVPQILGGRVQIKALYQLEDVAPGKVRRRYAGTIDVNVKLVSGKIERAIAAEVEKGMPEMTACTQRWLSRA